LEKEKKNEKINSKDAQEEKKMEEKKFTVPFQWSSFL